MRRERERDIIFLCLLLLYLPQTTCGTQPQTTGLVSASSGSPPSRSDAGTQLTAFSQPPPNPQPTFPVHDVIHTPWSYFISGVLFWYLWKTHPPPPRAREHLRSCLHLTHALSRKVLILTKPKGKHIQNEIPPQLNYTCTQAN